MASPTTRNHDLKALSRLISQADLTLSTITNPHPSVVRSRELLDAALTLSRDLASVAVVAADNPAVTLGAKGGNKTAERGPDYFKRIAAMRKTRGGGRPAKQTPSP